MEISHRSLTHPRYKIEKEYEVTLDRPWDPELASKLQRGIFVDGQRARIARLHSVSPVRLRVVLRQGINRQIAVCSKPLVIASKISFAFESLIFGLATCRAVIGAH